MLLIYDQHILLIMNIQMHARVKYCTCTSLFNILVRYMHKRRLTLNFGADTWDWGDK